MWKQFLKFWNKDLPKKLFKVLDECLFRESGETSVFAHVQHILKLHQQDQV